LVGGQQFGQHLLDVLGSMPLTTEDRRLLDRLTQPPRPSSDDDELIDLIERAQDGCTESGADVLSVMVFSLAAMARRSREVTFSQLISAAWVVMRGYNTQRRARVKANLVMDTLKHVTREQHAGDDVEPIPGAQADRHPTSSTTRPERTEARRVLDQAHRVGLLSPDNLRVLVEVYLHGYSGREAAQRLGMSHDMVRYRCSRTLRSLHAQREQLVGSLSG